MPTTISRTVLAELRALRREVAELRAVVAPPPRPPLFLDVELRESFLTWSRRERRNSRPWRRTQALYLAWWAQQLDGVNLRGADLAELLRHLDGVSTARRQRIVLLKSLYSWLRVVRHDVTTAEDPTFGQLTTPQTSPAQLAAVKAFPRSAYRATRAELRRGPYRDGLDVLAGTGWHVTELERFARSGTLDRRRRALRCPHSKGGVPYLVEVSPRVFAAAARLREHGAFSLSWFTRAVRAAAQAADVAVRAGSFRHAVSTYAVEHGSNARDVATFLNQRSERTQRLFYSTFAVPKKVRTFA